MEGLHHQLLRVPLPLHQRHPPRRVQEHPGRRPDEALLPSRHRHGPGHGRDGRLRQPRAGLHAARHRAAVRHALRHRQRAGRLPGAVAARPEASARSRTRRCSRSGRCSPACPASRPRRPSAATSAPSSSTSIPTGCAPTTCRPRRWSTALTAGNTISPSGNIRIKDQMPIVPVNAMVVESAGPGQHPDPARARTSTCATWATIEDSTDIPTGYALVNGRRAVYILVTKRADASTLTVVNEVKANLPQDAGGPARGHQGQLRVRPVALRHRGPCGASASRRLLGAVLTGLMVLLFLRDWRSVIVVVLNIPLRPAGRRWSPCG